MFNRWIQETDFKYLDKHFGINQLTSYRSTPYEQLRDELTDRQVPSHAYLAQVKTGRNLTHCHGVLRWTGTELEVHLVPQVNYPPKLWKIITAQLTTDGLSRGRWPQNALRHSHASYAVASGTPLETLLFEFGHTGNANVLRAHYVGKASKKKALEFFSIRPEGATASAVQLETVEGAA